MFRAKVKKPFPLSVVFQMDLLQSRVEMIPPSPRPKDACLCVTLLTFSFCPSHYHLQRFINMLLHRVKGSPPYPWFHICGLNQLWITNSGEKIPECSKKQNFTTHQQTDYTPFTLC